MRKMVLAAILALPFTAIGVQKASAWGCKDCGGGGCVTPTYKLGFSIGINWRGWALCDKCCFEPAPKPGGCCGGGPKCCGPACAVLGGNCCNPFVGGYGPIPPWYQFYPGGGAPSSGPNFPTPAPTGYPYGAGGTQMPVGSPLFGANFNNMQAPVAPAPQVMPCGYYPQAQGYWNGR